jgi:hypothetical protein
VDEKNRRRRYEELVQMTKREIARTSDLAARARLEEGLKSNEAFEAEVADLHAKHQKAESRMEKLARDTRIFVRIYANMSPNRAAHADVRVSAAVWTCRRARAGG